MNALLFSLGTLIVILPALAWADDDEDVISVGQNAAGQVIVDTSFPQPVVLPPSVYPGISGDAFGDLGVHSAGFDDPAHDFYKLSTAADFRLILLAKDAGMEVWNDSGSAYMQIGESFYVGQPIFDTHPLWNLVTGTPGVVYSLTMKMHDLSGIYPDSAPFQVKFTQLLIPRLQISASQNPAQLTLSWSTNASGWLPESAVALTEKNWSQITNAPSIIGTNFSLTVDFVESQQFFRLHHE